MNGIEQLTELTARTGKRPTVRAMSGATSSDLYRLDYGDESEVLRVFRAERITGIVDWINACMGPVGIDVAHCRLNLALMYGLKTADEFLEQYTAAAPGYVHESFWDIEDALGALPEVTVYPPWVEFGLEGLTDEIVRQRLQSFVAAAVSRAVSP